MATCPAAQWEVSADYWLGVISMDQSGTSTLPHYPTLAGGKAAAHQNTFAEGGLAGLFRLDIDCRLAALLQRIFICDVPAAATFMAAIAVSCLFYSDRYLEFSGYRESRAGCGRG